MITGAVNSGKTTQLLKLYNAGRQGEGFALPKYYINGNYAGQKIVRLSNGDSTIFSLTESYIPAHWQEEFHYKNYSFSLEGMHFANHISDDIIMNNLNPVFIDEIGPLEIQKKGFYSITCKMIAYQKDLFLTVRSACIQDIISLFDIKLCRLIQV
ncbi:nucleoside-triphosphatase [Caproiciproducens sp.]|uniref:nucleoside-triphosphatase n=1 Tax=Caproiciproducens sp. TaxID=1954376 RepID=UPI00289C82F0|nr:nucleoside-triphosphatase [Caproiciproducens sp.]